MSNPNIIKFSIPPDVYFKLMEEINKKNESHSNKLAGNIRRQENINQCIPFLENVIYDILNKSPELVENTAKRFYQSISTRNLKNNEHTRTMCLDALWVNHQKQYEFNPLHHHDGLFSFILFMKIPFLIKELRDISPGIDSNLNSSGRLQFVYAGSSHPEKIYDMLNYDVDKSWEGTGLIFPSSFLHLVYPFYGEGVRITVSGNIYAMVNI